MASGRAGETEGADGTAVAVAAEVLVVEPAAVVGRPLAWAATVFPGEEAVMIVTQIREPGLLN